ncbi:MAG TPA: DUF924 family protein [Allosphingosinicella sp.]|nr:DUF924 family protein [Allosphingosinicella sp.]
MAWQDEVLDYWFGLDPKLWWNGGPELDADICGRFLDLWEEQRQRPVADFLAGPRQALAAIVLFDQFPRNMHRGHADQFATDHIALIVAKAAVEREWDGALAPVERGILYMPFQHSEDLDDQRRSLALFTALGDGQLDFARKHFEVIERFGRFPHRNAVLGRTPRPAELDAGDVFPW